MAVYAFIQLQARAEERDGVFGPKAVVNGCWGMAPRLVRRELDRLVEVGLLERVDGEELRVVAYEDWNEMRDEIRSRREGDRSKKAEKRARVPPGVPDSASLSLFSDQDLNARTREDSGSGEIAAPESLPDPSPAPDEDGSSSISGVDRSVPGSPGERPLLAVARDGPENTGVSPPPAVQPEEWRRDADRLGVLHAPAVFAKFAARRALERHDADGWRRRWGEWLADQLIYQASRPEAGERAGPTLARVPDSRAHERRVTQWERDRVPPPANLLAALGA
jgi:hypothetical protein